jgi:hypoxanthine-guanine phosphoribosyltransferase
VQDYHEFLDMPDKYIFGYDGIDIDEHYRNLPFIATADLSRYQPPDVAGGE